MPPKTPPDRSNSTGNVLGYYLPSTARLERKLQSWLKRKKLFAAQPVDSQLETLRSKSDRAQTDTSEHVLIVSALVIALAALQQNYPKVYCMGAVAGSLFLMHHSSDTTTANAPSNAPLNADSTSPEIVRTNQSQRVNIALSCLGLLSPILIFVPAMPASFQTALLVCQLAMCATVVISALHAGNIQTLIDAVSELCSQVCDEHAALEDLAWHLLRMQESPAGASRSSHAILLIERQGDEQNIHKTGIKVLASQDSFAQNLKSFNAGALDTEDTHQEVSELLQSTMVVPERSPQSSSNPTTKSFYDWARLEYDKWSAIKRTDDPLDLRQAVSLMAHRSPQLGKCSLRLTLTGKRLKLYVLRLTVWAKKQDKASPPKLESQTRQMVSLRQIRPLSFKTEVKKKPVDELSEPIFKRSGNIYARSEQAHRKFCTEVVEKKRQHLGEIHFQNESNSAEQLDSGAINPIDLDSPCSESLDPINRRATDHNGTDSQTIPSVDHLLMAGGSPKNNRARSNPTNRMRPRISYHVPRFNSSTLLDDGSEPVHRREVRTFSGLRQSAQKNAINRCASMPVRRITSSSNEGQSVFVYQIIHDIRHPLDAQKALVQEYLNEAASRLRGLKFYLDDDNKFQVKGKIKAQLDDLKKTIANIALKEAKNKRKLKQDESMNVSKKSDSFAFDSLESVSIDGGDNKMSSPAPKELSSQVEQLQAEFESAKNNFQYQARVRDVESDSDIIAPVSPRDSRGSIQAEQHDSFDQAQSIERRKQSMQDALGSGRLNVESEKGGSDSSVQARQSVSPRKESNRDDQSSNSSVSGEVGEEEGLNWEEKFDDDSQCKGYKFNTSNGVVSFRRSFGEQDLEEFVSVNQIEPVVVKPPQFALSFGPELLFAKNKQVQGEVKRVKAIQACQSIFSSSRNGLHNLVGPEDLQRPPIHSNLLSYSKSSLQDARRSESRALSQKNMVLNAIGNGQGNLKQHHSLCDVLQPIGQPSSAEGAQIDVHTAKLIRFVLSERKVLIQIADRYIQFVQSSQSAFEKMHGQTQMTMVLMKDLLDFAQLKNGSFSIVNEYFDLTKTIKQSLETSRSAAQLNKVVLEGPVFAEEDSALYFKQVYGDSRRYMQVLINFVSNAIKFSKPGGTVKVLLNLSEVRPLSLSSQGEYDCEVGENGQDKKRGQNETISEKVSEEDRLEVDSDEPTSPRSAPDKDLGEESKGDSEQLCSIYSDESPCEYTTVDIEFEMVIQDSGVGISEENQKKLFSNFGKLKDTKGQNKSGVGLGLTISRDLIQAFGGSIDIKSEEGRGTDFIIKLKAKSKVRMEDGQMVKIFKNEQASKSDKNILSEPYQMSQGSWDSIQDDPSLVVAPSSQPAKGEEKLQRINAQGHIKRNCLLANDNTFLLSIYESVLQTQFDQVDSVTDGQQAINHVKEQEPSHYSIIVLDINMPIKTGMEACAEIQAYFRSKQSLSGDCLVERNEASEGAKESLEGLHALDFSDRLKKVQRNCKSLVRPDLYSGFDDSASSSKSAAQKYKRIQQQSQTVIVDDFPPVVAVTSEINLSLLKLYQDAGFSNVYSELTIETLSKILDQQKMVIRSARKDKGSYSGYSNSNGSDPSAQKELRLSDSNSSSQSGHSGHSDQSDEQLND